MHYPHAYYKVVIGLLHYYTSKWVFYNLVSCCISYRIKFTLDTLITNTLTDFIQGMFIGENTFFL